MDYRRFLNASQEQVLPWLGGRQVAMAGRDLRLSAPLEAPGWYRFEVKGRTATPRGPADPPELSGLPAVRGHLLSGWRVVDAQGRVERFRLPPDDEPPPCSPLTCRRWHDGSLLFAGIEFETEAEEQARAALDAGVGLTAKGVPSSLRAAFAYHQVEAAAARLEVPVDPLEVRLAVPELSAGGPEAAERVLRHLATRRAAARVVVRGPGAAVAASNARVARAAEALAGAGAELLRARSLERGEQLEVTYRFMGSRFRTVVVAETLHVLDAGVCLDGADEELTLDSLPAVLREAIDTGQLVITAHVPDDM